MFVYLCSRPAHRHSLMAGFMADAHINIDYPSANCGHHARVWNRTFALMLKLALFRPLLVGKNVRLYSKKNREKLAYIGKI